jgi:hypothetical protein
MTSGDKIESIVTFPHWSKSLAYCVVAVVLSQIIMYLDHARGAAYIFTPLILLNMWRTSANINWKSSKSLTLVCLAFGVFWAVLGELTLLQIISIENGEPIVESGVFFELTNDLAAKKLTEEK